MNVVHVYLSHENSRNIKIPVGSSCQGVFWCYLPRPFAGKQVFKTTCIIFSAKSCLKNEINTCGCRLKKHWYLIIPKPTEPIIQFIYWVIKFSLFTVEYKLKSLIMAQIERWRQALNMQVERESFFGSE